MCGGGDVLGTTLFPVSRDSRHACALGGERRHLELDSTMSSFKKMCVQHAPFQRAWLDRVPCMNIDVRVETYEYDERTAGP